jgi:signal transduction histidine kinase
MVAELTGVDLSEVLELDPAAEEFVLRAGVHWKRGLLGKAQIPADDLLFLQAVTNVIATAHERRKTEAELETAEEAIRDRDEFISVASHELRTPLTALQLKLQGIEQLMKKAPSPSDQTPNAMAPRLSSALKQTNRLNELVERLLDVSRIVSGRLRLEPEELDLAVLLADAAEALREQAQNAGTPLRITAAGDARGVWDRSRIDRMLTNVLSNAVKYGGGKPVEIELLGRQNEVEIRVIDRGIGIPAENLERIFGRFERAVPVQNYGGLGLGLYIARYIVEAHGGTITVASKVGSGSTFTIILPKNPPANAAAEAFEGAR